MDEDERREELRRLDDLRHRAEAVAGVLALHPDHVQLSRLVADAQLLEHTILADALGLLEESTARALGSPRLAGERGAALLRVHRALAGLGTVEDRRRPWLPVARFELGRMLMELWSGERPRVP